MPGPAQGDRATAMTLVSAILMALIHRMKTGEGSWVGTSLLGNGLWSCGVIAQAALVGAFLPHRPPPDRPRSALGNIYRTSDDRWLQLTIVREDKMWPPLCEAIGRPELVDDPRFATSSRTAQALGRTGRYPGRGLRQPRLRALAQGAVGARHHLRRHQPAAGRARRRAGGGLRRRRRHRDPRDAAYARQPDPPRLRQAAHRQAGAGARPAQRRDPARGRPVARTRSPPRGERER